jgi:hypothetical protein
MNAEEYVNPYDQPKKKKSRTILIQEKFSLEEAIQLISETIKEIRKPDPDII